MPWYMVHEDGKFMVFWQFIFAVLVLINYLYAPFITAFSGLRTNPRYDTTINNFEFFIEFFWIQSIIVNFVTASTEKKIFTFKESSRRYLRQFAIPDMFAVFGNIYITYFAGGVNQSGSQSVILFIRFTHFNAMFYPIRYYIRHYTMYNKKRESQII